MISRRTFLSSAAWPLAASLHGDESPPSIIDTHTHFYDPTRPQGVAWPSREDKFLYRPVLPDEFKKLARPLGVVGTIVVEASPWLEDNQWLVDLAAKDRFLLGIVGRLTPGGDDFERDLRRFAANERFRGIRINHDTLKQGLRSDRFLEHLKKLCDANLELDVNGGPEMPTDVARLADRLGDLRIVINHEANVRIDGREAPLPWKDAMTAAARHPRVFCKVSALAEGTGAYRGQAPRELAYYRPVLDALWNAFGAERLIYGSNWPVSARAADYAAQLGVVRAYFNAKGRAASEKFFARNAQVAYRIGS
jgi:L-fuconolactonase